MATALKYRARTALDDLGDLERRETSLPVTQQRRIIHWSPSALSMHDPVILGEAAERPQEFVYGRDVDVGMAPHDVSAAIAACEIVPASTRHRPFSCRMMHLARTVSSPRFLKSIS